MKREDDKGKGVKGEGDNKESEEKLNEGGEALGDKDKDGGDKGW